MTDMGLRTPLSLKRGSGVLDYQGKQRAVVSPMKVRKGVIELDKGAYQKRCAI